MKIPMVDLKAQVAEIREELEAEWSAVLSSGAFVLGPNVRAFEAEAAAFLGVNHAIGVASGTDALHLAMRAAGIGPGDEVITTAFTFVATAEAVCYTGATPVFADIDPESFNLDPEAVLSRVTRRTRAILPVHLYGRPADMRRYREICVAKGLLLMEDAAQAFGAELDGQRAGGIGDLGCFSFYPSKNLGAFGDGGLVVTNDATLANRVRSSREHHHQGGYRHAAVGYNSRLDEVQAVVLRIKLRKLEDWNARRRQVAAAYHQQLAELPLVLPTQSPGHAWHQFTIRSPRRDAIRNALTEAGIASSIYYPVPCHLQPAFQGSDPLPNTEKAAAEVLSLPMHPHLSEAQIAQVVESVKRGLLQ